MASTSLESAKHWLDRAEEARALAEHMHDAWARTAMLTTAWGYEQLARHAELRHYTGDASRANAREDGDDLRRSRRPRPA